MARKSKSTQVVTKPLVTFVQDEFVIDGYDFEISHNGSLASQARAFYQLGEKRSTIAKYFKVSFQQVRQATVGMTQGQRVFLQPVPCKCCAIRLTNPVSIARQLGPICVNHFNVETGQFEHPEGEEDEA
jgi:Family of unknown function (DUF6011)